MKKRGLLIIVMVLVCLFGSSIPVFGASGLSDDPYVSVISPSNNAVMRSGNVLVSVKMTAPRYIRMSFYEINGSGRQLITTENYYSGKSLSYYTRQLSGLSTGVYCVNVSTLNASGKAIYATEIYLNVQKKTSSDFQIDVFNSSGTSSSFWSYLLGRLLS